MLKKTNEYLYQIKLYPKGTPLVKGGGSLTDLLYAANPVYLDVDQGESFCTRKVNSMLIPIGLLAAAVCFYALWVLMYFELKDFGLWSIGGGAFWGTAILTALAFWRLFKSDVNFMVALFYMMAAWAFFAILVAFVFDRSTVTGALCTWFILYTVTVLMSALTILVTLFVLSFARIFTTPTANIARFDRKRQKVFVRIDPVLIKFSDITLKNLLHYQGVFMEIPWADLRPAVKHHSMLIYGRVFQGMFVEPKPGAWDGTEKSIRITNNALHIVKIDSPTATGMTGTRTEDAATYMLEAIRRFMEEGQPPTMYRPRWRNLYRPNWQAIFSEYESAAAAEEAWVDETTNIFTPMNPKKSKFRAILMLALELCVISLRAGTYAFLFIFFTIPAIFNWWAVNRAPHPQFPEKIRRMHESDLEELQIDAYGNPLQADSKTFTPKPPAPPANLSPATHKKLLLLDKALACIAFSCALSSPFLLAAIITADLPWFSPLIASGIAMLIARLSLPLARQIKPEGVWIPSVPPTEPVPLPTLDDYLPEIVVRLKTQFRRWQAKRAPKPAAPKPKNETPQPSQSED